MSQQDRRRILKNVRVVKSIAYRQNRRKKSKLESLNTISDNNTSFLLDLLVILIGQNELINLFNGLLTRFVPSFLETYKRLLSESILKFPSANNNILEADYKTTIENLDRFEIAKYRKNNNRIFEQAYIDAVDSNAFISVDQNGNNTGKFFIRYNDESDLLTFRIRQSGQNLSDLLSNTIINQIEFDTNGIIEQIIDEIFGITNKQRDLIDFESVNEIDELIQNIVDTPPNEITADNERLFKRKKADKSDSIVLSFSCQETQIQPEQQSLSTLLTDNYFRNPENLTDNVNRLIKNSTGVDNEAVQKEFNTTLINRILNIILKNTIFSPETVIIQLILKATSDKSIVENIPFVTNEDFVRENIQLIKCMSEELKEQIYNFIFDTFSDELEELIIQVAREISREAASNYLTILKGLV